MTVEKPVRKPNRLAEYDYSQPGYYFVTICTKDRRECLGTVVGADVLIGPKMELSETGQKVQKILMQMPTVEKFVVMPNHIHMLVWLSEDGAMGTSPPT